MNLAFSQTTVSQLTGNHLSLVSLLIEICIYYLCAVFKKGRVRLLGQGSCCAFLSRLRSLCFSFEKPKYFRDSALTLPAGLVVSCVPEKEFFMEGG